jgi:hypothetical protein
MELDSILRSAQDPGITRLGFTVSQAALANLADGTGPRITLQDQCYLADMTLYGLSISLDSSPLFRHAQPDSDFGFSFTCIASHASLLHMHPVSVPTHGFFAAVYRSHLLSTCVSLIVE